MNVWTLLFNEARPDDRLRLAELLVKGSLQHYVERVLLFGQRSGFSCGVQPTKGREGCGDKNSLLRCQSV